MKIRFPYNIKMFYRYYPTQAFYGLIWNMAEYFRIDLGKYAPTVFGKMIGSKGKKINKE